MDVLTVQVSGSVWPLKKLKKVLITALKIRLLLVTSIV